MQPSEKLTWQDSDLFAPMDQNLPEGDLFIRIRAMYPKQPMTPMHLLALIGSNGIGRLAYHLPGQDEPQPPVMIAKQDLLKLSYTTKVFDKLVAAYLSTRIGIAGMQPKIMVPDRPTIPIPSLIIKAASESYPGLTCQTRLVRRLAVRH